MHRPTLSLTLGVLAALMLIACSGPAENREDSAVTGSPTSPSATPRSGTAAADAVSTATPPARAPGTIPVAAGAERPRVERPALDPGRDTSCTDDTRSGKPAPLPEPVLAGVVCRTILVDGFPRDFVVYIPAEVVEPAPVVLMYHGSSGTGPQFLRSSGWRQKADEVGFLAVFPTGLEYFVLEERRISTKWNDLSLAEAVDIEKTPRGYPEGAPWPADDVKFTYAMMDDVGALLAIDRSRLYASGFSNGSAFVARLAVEASDLFAAVAGNFGLLREATMPKAPIPRFVTVGHKDERLLMAFGISPALPMTIAGLRAIPPIEAGIEAELSTWALADEPVIRERPTIAAARWSTPLAGNDLGNVFQLAILRGMGHEYPNGGNNDAGFVAADEFWAFFSTHAK